MKNGMAQSESGSCFANQKTSSCAGGNEKVSRLIIDSVVCGSPEGD